MKISSFILGAAAGAAAVWFLDPKEGARRRDQGIKYARQGAAEAQTKAQQVAGQAQGAAAQVKSDGGEDPAERLGDQGLRDKVESEIFRDADVDKGRVLVSVEDAIVYLRGELEPRQLRERLAHAARGVAGVRDVENMLHGPGEPAPMRQEPGVTG